MVLGKSASMAAQSFKPIATVTKREGTGADDVDGTNGNAKFLMQSSDQLYKYF